MLYLALVHGDTEVDDLRRGCANLHMELSERTGQLKALVSQASVEGTWVPSWFAGLSVCMWGLPDCKGQLKAAVSQGGLKPRKEGASTAWCQSRLLSTCNWHVSWPTCIWSCQNVLASTAEQQVCPLAGSPAHQSAAGVPIATVALPGDMTAGHMVIVGGGGHDTRAQCWACWSHAGEREL